MFPALAILVPLISAGAALIGFAWVMALRLPAGPHQPADSRWVVAWAVKGLGAPILLWAAMNIGLSQSLQPFMPQVQAMQNKGAAWFPVFLSVTAAGWFAISSSWCAVTLGWMISRTHAGLKGEVRDDFRSLCVASFTGMFLPAVILLYLGGWVAIGAAAVALLGPIAGCTPSILERKRLPPMYARAVAKMNFGKYSEAEWAIIHELEKHEDDFNGWLMLAELYATRFHDLAEAEQTILEICDQPRTTSSQLSVALHKLADWNLNLAGDPDAARRALQVICDRLPGTHLARMAQMRLSHLPRNAEELSEQRQVHTIALPALSANFEETTAPAPAGLDSPQAAELAKQLKSKLTRDPNNVVTREKLARLLAEQLGQLDSAIAQVELLLDLEGQPDDKRAEWLSFIASWQLRQKHDQEARRVLQRLVDEFPAAPQALTARRRLKQMELEQVAQQHKPPPIKIKITHEPPPTQENGLAG